MDMLNPDTWKHLLEAFASAPYYIMLPLIAAAWWAGWWLRGIKSERRIDGLEARLRLADERAAWADKVKNEGVKAIEAARQFEELKAEIVANAGNGALAERVAKVEAAVEKLSVVNTVRSAIATAVGVSAAVGIGGIGESLPGKIIRADKE